MSNGWGKGRRGGRSTGFDVVRRLSACGSAPVSPPPPLFVYMAESNKTEGLALLPTAHSDWTSLRPSGVPPRSSAGALSAPSYRPSPPPRPPAASTTSYPPFLINSLSLPTFPPLLPLPPHPRQRPRWRPNYRGRPPLSRRHSTYRIGLQAQTTAPVTQLYLA